MGLELELELGEEICSECGGSGAVGGKWFNRRSCPKCLGDGKLDWIENVVGKRPRYGYSGGSGESGSSLSSSSLSSSC